MTYIIPDTNVIVSASINYCFEEIGNIKHIHHDESYRLFNLISQTASVRGIFLKKVNSECWGALLKAIKDTISKETTSRKLKEVYYENTNEITFPFILEMINLLQNLDYVKEFDTEQLNKSRQDVKNMVKELEHSKDNSKQLDRLREKSNTDDEEILTQSVTFKRSHRARNSHVLIASKDMGFFSPLGKSNTVTKRICDEFKIRCDHPEEIIRIVKGESKTKYC